MLDTKEDIYLEYIAGTLLKSISEGKIQQNDHTRQSCCFFGPEFAYNYALYIDKRSDTLTRKVAGKDPAYALTYALLIDNGPHEVTRAGACREPEWALLYLENVDQKPHPSIKKATSLKNKTKISYELFVEKLKNSEK